MNSTLKITTIEPTANRSITITNAIKYNNRIILINLISRDNISIKKIFKNRTAIHLNKKTILAKI